jgi:hypothetical protein
VSQMNVVHTLKSYFFFKYILILWNKPSLIWLQLIRSRGHAVAQGLDAGFPPWQPGFAYGQHVGFVVDKAALGRVFSEYFGFLCQSFHRFLHYHNHPGLTQ